MIAVFAIGFFLQSFTASIPSTLVPAIFLIATGLVYLLVWMALIDIMRLSKLHPFAIFGVWGACYGCPRILHYFVDALMEWPEQGSSDVMTTVIALFGLFVSLFLLSRQPTKLPRALESRTNASPKTFGKSLAGDLPKLPDRQAQGAAPNVPDPQQPSAIDLRKIEVVTEYRLTEHEAEVFYLACDGHSRRYVAEQLFISENTVKAHLKKIYAKMDIHSKYDLEKILWENGHPLDKT
jgi:DNA-binding CsgD family transcriptional regulator